MIKKYITLLLVLFMFTSNSMLSVSANNADDRLYGISVDSEQFQELAKRNSIPAEVLNYISETKQNYPTARIELMVTSEKTEETPRLNFTNYRTYAGHELADYIIHVVNAHDMQNVVTGASAGGFASKILFYLGTSLVSGKFPFYSSVVTAADYLYTNGTFYSEAGDKLGAAPAYDTYSKFTYVKWYGNYTFGVQTFKAKVTTIAWYLWSQADQHQYAGVATYNYTFKSVHYDSPDSTAVNNYQSGGISDPSPRLKIKNRYFALY